jgi:hypothetical protein
MATTNGDGEWRRQMAAANGGGEWRRQMAAVTGYVLFPYFIAYALLLLLLLMLLWKLFGYRLFVEVRSSTYYR